MTHVPHAECRGATIFWRGSDDWFRPMEPSVARWIAGRDRLGPTIHADLLKAIANQDQALIAQGVSDAH